ncbi:MAG: hypothetical protein DGJ47_000568 [Rickettsiaceae bacterium]
MKAMIENDYSSQDMDLVNSESSNEFDRNFGIDHINSESSVEFEFIIEDYIIDTMSSLDHNISNNFLFSSNENDFIISAGER